jgi:pentatricopeptide repeat protein
MKMVSDNNSRQRQRRRKQNARRCSYAFMLPYMMLLLVSSAVVVVSAWSTTSNSNKATLHSYSFTTSSSQQRLQRQPHRLITTTTATTSTSLPFSNAVTALEAEVTSGGEKESSKQKQKQKNKIRGKTTKNKNNNKSNQKKGQQVQQPKNKQQSQQPRRGWKGEQKQKNKRSTTKKKTTRKKFNSVSELVLEVRKLLNSTTTSTLSQSQSQSRRPNSSWRTALSILKHAATIPHDAIIVDDKDKDNSVDDLNDLESILSTTPKMIADKINNDIDDDNGNYLLSSATTATTQPTTAVSTTPTKTILPVRVYHQVLECIKKQKTASSWQDAIRLIQYMENGGDGYTDNNISNININSNSNINRGGGGYDDTWYIPSPNYEIYNTVIECTSQGGRKDSDDASVYWLSKMLQKFDKDDNKNISIRDRKLVRNTIQLVLSNLSKQRKWREALRLLDYMEMKSDEIPISVVQYNTVLGCLAKSNQVGQCQRLLQRLQMKSKEQQQQRQKEEKESEQPDNDDDDSPTTTVVAAKTTYPLLLRPDEISYNAVIGACASAGKWKEALDVLDECYNEPGVEPNIYIYTNAIRACAKAGKTQRALSLLDIVKEKSLPVDSYCYTAVIDACSKGRQWKKALELFDEMEEKGIVPTQVTYSVTISALGNGLQWEQALSLLNVVSTITMMYPQIDDYVSTKIEESWELFTITLRCIFALFQFAHS